ncbi:acyltransferase-like protein At3g26840, chloroplastic isoform X2 [Punica granatum]|uniref:Acyltransferase-like protein At3g26840, chloroplastic isoform X2 n=1 Tax=Punica granatum TaxID=22663 RepID=A0A6P8CRU4_PUNGR|nr:acyltransferase-like protein At3g26840, chloroplastic isoform X2 [Punica granatum]
MAAAGGSVFASGFPPGIPRHSYPAPRARRLALISSTQRLFAVSTAEQLPSAPTSVPGPTPTTEGELGQNRRHWKDREPNGSAAASPFMEDEGSELEGKKRLEDFFDLAKDLIRSAGGLPRWFSPLECASRINNSPLLLYLPGIDGTGAGLASQHKKLGKIFDVWCLHIPVMDRTPFTDLVKLIEKTVKSESHNSPNRPIYLVGESLGACLALAVAARNPDLDLVLILSNPATSFNASQAQSLVPLLEIMPDQVQLTHPYLLSLMRGDPLNTLRATSEKALPPQEMVAELSKDLLNMSAFISVLADILPKGTFLWKLQMLKSASAYTNSRLHAVKAQTLLLISERDQLLPSQAEASRLYRAVPGCEIRRYEENGHFLFLVCLPALSLSLSENEDGNGIDLVTTIKGATFYRRGKSQDYISDYLPPTHSEFIKLYESSKWFNDMTAPVMLSTLEDGTIVRGLAGIPYEGPVLLVGYHMLLGLEIIPLMTQFLIERNIHLRGIAHPMLFPKYKEHGSTLSPFFYDAFHIMGAVPVSGANLFKLFSRKSHVLLYPGGAREALHRKGEEYKLFWPEQAEFVRMAAKFGAKIVPFGTVGEDDIGQVVLDYEDLMKIPYYRDQIRRNTEGNVKLRTTATGEVANQDMHLPGVMPKIPGRFYYLFGKPIDTEGRKQELKDRKKSHELYLEVKSEVERCIAYLQDKREGDPYRSIFSRLVYQTVNGSSSDIPTFEL